MIVSLELEHYGPFQKRVTLPLAGQGLVMVRGKNLVSQACDANGVGKTSIPHGIASTLFGEDLDGRVADAVACRFTKDTCRMHMALEDDLGQWTITRTRRPTSLGVTGIDGVLENEDAKVLQQKIVQRLGFGLRTFKNAVVFGQGAFERFAQADQVEAMRMLDEIQGVDFRADLQRAKDWRDQLTGKLDALREDERLASAQAATVAASVADMSRARDGFEAARSQRVAAIEDRVTVITARIRGLDADADAVTGLVATLATLRAGLAELSKLDDELAVKKRAAAAVKSTADHAADDERVAAAELSSLEARLDALLEQGACPSCRRPVKSQRAAVRKLFDREIKDLATRLTAVSSAWAEAFAAQGEADEVITDAETVIDARETALIRLVPAGESITTYAARLEERCGPRAAQLRAAASLEVSDELRSATSDLDLERSRAWEGADALAAAQGRAASAAASLVAARERADKVNRVISLAEYCVEALGDRGVRSMLVDGVADYVNERLVEHLEKLTCGEASTRMSAQTATKTGKVRDAISFKTDWAWGGDGPDDGSGGMDRRRDLAIFAAVQDLSESRSARPFPLKIWDEPGDNLDSRGQEMFLRWVESEARARGTGLLITHSETIASQANPDRVWTVVLTRDGAHVEIG